MNKISIASIAFVISVATFSCKKTTTTTDNKEVKSIKVNGKEFIRVETETKK